MGTRQTSYRTGRPITIKGRIMLSGCLLLVGITLGFAASIALYNTHRPFFRASDLFGAILCGSGQHIDDVPSKPHGTRMICRDAEGQEISARNNFIAVNMALPFIILFSIPFQMLAWFVSWHEVKR